MTVGGVQSLGSSARDTLLEEKENYCANMKRFQDYCVMRWDADPGAVGFMAANEERQVDQVD